MGDARISSIDIDAASLAPTSPEADHERKIAIFDLLEDNTFKVLDHDGGPFAVRISLVDQRLVFEVAEEDGTPVKSHVLSVTGFRRVIKDYFIICDSYYEAIRSASPSQIEAIDMGRRGLHNEGSELLVQRFAGKIEMDFDTARRLFTLVCALHLRN